MAVENVFVKLSSYYKKGTLAHAYLIETNDSEKCLTDVLKFLRIIFCNAEFKDNCQKCNVCHMVENQEFPNLVIIRPDGKTIKKEQILGLKHQMNFMPTLSINSAYIIMDAEKLNGASANTMLKFIEEPVDNCYGFFITNSKENTLLTIQSRCECEKIIYQSGDIFSVLQIDSEKKLLLLENIQKYLSDIEINNLGIMSNYNCFFKEYKDNNDVENGFKVILDIYETYFYDKMGMKNQNNYSNFSFIEKNTLKQLECKIRIIVNVINDLRFNLNMDLLLDRFVIEMDSVK